MKKNPFKGMAGNIVNCIMEAGFEISAINVYLVERANAQEFYEVCINGKICLITCNLF